MKIKRYDIFWAFEPWWLCFFPLVQYEETGEWGFLKPSFKFWTSKNKYTDTHWYYLWILHLGWLYIYKKTDYKMKKQENWNWRLDLGARP